MIEETMVADKEIRAEDCMRQRWFTNWEDAVDFLTECRRLGCYACLQTKDGKHVVNWWK